MIAVIEGAVGAGKTYYAVRMIVDHLRHGGIVATNLSLNISELRYLCRRRISSSQLIQVDATFDPRKIPRGDLRGHGKRRVVVVLDEALNWFASSSAKDDPRKDTWGEWLRQSDKLGQQVFFIAQRFDRAAKWLRELAQLCYSICNLGQLRFLGIPWGKIFGLKRVSVAMKYDLSIKSKVGTEFYLLSPEVWRCYDTSVLYGFEASANAYDSASGIWPPHPFPTLALRLLTAFFFWGFLRLLWVCLM